MNLNMEAQVFTKIKTRTSVCAGGVIYNLPTRL